MSDFKIKNGVLTKYTGIGGDVVIPDGVTSIGDWVFSHCSSLTSITIPDSVTSIGEWAFAGCSNLTSVTIPDSVTSIDSSAFYQCSSLTSITIGDSVTSIGGGAFYDCSDLAAVHISDIAAWCNIDFRDHDSNPLSYANNLYLNGDLVTDLVIPDSVTSIGRYAFAHCSSLKSITIPDSVTSIGSYAFYGTQVIEIERGVSYVGKWVVDCDTSITSVKIKDGTVGIASSAFNKCSKLTRITIPDSVTSIGEIAFYGCSSLTRITIPDSVTSIGGLAFAHCSLTSITIPDSVTSIGAYAFEDCSSLTSITIGDSVTSIGDLAFDGCSSLKSITVDKNNSMSLIDFFMAGLYPTDGLFLKDDLNDMSFKEKCSALKCFLKHIEEYPEEKQKMYFDYARKQGSKLLTTFIEEEDKISVSKLLEVISPTLNAIDKAIETARGNVEIEAALLDYKNKNFNIKKQAEKSFEQFEL